RSRMWTAHPTTPTRPTPWPPVLPCTRFCWRRSAQRRLNDPRADAARLAVPRTPPPNPLPEAERGSRSLSPPLRLGEGAGGRGAEQILRISVASADTTGYNTFSSDHV